jgi:glyoxylase-like metal-dependent hydrolase (beta-lactamase superfamily II)
MIQFKNKHFSVFESALFRTNSVVVETEDLILVADPGWLPHEVAAIRHHVDAIKNGRPVYLLFTHSDYDHILGFGAFPNAYTIASQSFMDNPKKEEQLRTIQKFDQEYYIRRPYKMCYPRVDIAVDGKTEFITIGDTRLSFWQAPGHNADGIFTLIEPLGLWLAGDYLSNEEFPFIYHGAGDYLKTLDTAEKIIKERQPKYLIPGHGDVSIDTSEMFVRLQQSRDYILQLRDAISKGERFPEEQLWERYDFRVGQEEFHRKNVDLIREEYGLPAAEEPSSPSLDSSLELGAGSSI